MKFFDRFRKDKQPDAGAVAAAEPAAAPVAEIPVAPAPEPAPPAVSAPAAEPPVVDLKKDEPKKPGLFTRLKAGLRRTGSSFSEGIGNLFLGKKEIDDELLEELETRLLLADVGIDATQHIVG